MVKNKAEDTNKKNNENKGYREEKGLCGKAKRHQAAALKKNADAISEDVAIVPEPSQASVETNDNVETDMELRFEDTDAFLDALKEFENENDMELAMDFDTDSYIVSVPLDKVKEFQKFMTENGIKEIPNTQEINDKIADVQKTRSILSLALDKSKTASRVGDKSNPDDLKDWLKNPNKLDLEGIDTKNL